MLFGEHARQILQWLSEPITLEQAEARYADLEQATLESMGATGGWLAHFRKEITAEFQPGDELWLYDSGVEAWAHLHGERGLAHVRDGQVVGHFLECRN